jgi:formylglycine-generating enzyme required for sulfatase activity
MLFSCDRAGFPLVHVPGAGLTIQLFPTTKVQFERFLAEPAGFGDAWYAAVLAANPRVSLRSVDDATRERLFLTGLLPEEGQQYARWLGDGFRLPTAEEWQAAYRVLQGCDYWAYELEQVLDACCDAARLLYQRVLALALPTTLAELALMTGGVLEWVRDGAQWGGYGLPRPTLYDVLCDPLTCPPVLPMRATDRLGFFGIRAVRRG